VPDTTFHVPERRLLERTGRRHALTVKLIIKLGALTARRGLQGDSQCIKPVLDRGMRE
jgi:hypothetical protein